MSQKIALVGGGTGGHIVPILSLIAQLTIKTPLSSEGEGSGVRRGGEVREKVLKRREVRGISLEQFFWIGGNASMEQAKAQEAGVRFVPITTYKLASTKSLGVLLYPFKLLQGIFDASRILKAERPKLVFSKGGPGSVAVGIAAWSLGIPLYIHESDTVPGFSNRVLGYFATRIFLGFEEAKKYFPEHKTTLVGQILHPDFYAENPGGNIAWKTDKKHIFVSCGSQGSRKVFQALLDQNIPPLAKEVLTKEAEDLSKSPLPPFSKGGNTNLSPLSSGSKIHRGGRGVGGEGFRELAWGEAKGSRGWDFPDTEWIISLGTLNTNMRPEFEKWEDTQVFDWIPQTDIPHILDGADIAITRASATTLAELATRPIHLIIVPLAISAGDHQLANARVYEKHGHTVILEEDLDKTDIDNIIRRSKNPESCSDSGKAIAPLLALFDE